MGVKKKILDALDRFLLILREKTLQTLEEIEANTSEGYWAGADAVDALNNKLMSGLGGNNLIYNESEDAYYIQHGADAALKKLGKGEIIIPSMSCGIGGNATASSGYRLDVSEYKKMSIGSYTASGTYAYVDINGFGTNNEKIFKDTFGSSFNAKVYDITNCKSVFFNFNCQAGTATLQNIEIS